MEKGEFLYKEETYQIIGACFEVYKEKGCGFLEAVYQECLAIEFKLQGIPYEPQKTLPLSYKKQPLDQIYKADFVCFGKIILEIKAADKLTDKDRSQVLNYLNATGFEVGLLVNFGHHPKIEHERFVLTKSRGSV
ncbi:MAG: GxxExxY protein [Kiritimatiellales bacterium]|jgi:GxxExxY protein